mmetsp:Transcript_96763/g.301817  ORF Transcript_96763/g.301817 Transcript_96763/m.301817 type:complete len:694 (-) Transcript_96763:27-2108(-)
MHKTRTCHGACARRMRLTVACMRTQGTLASHVCRLRGAQRTTTAGYCLQAFGLSVDALGGRHVVHLIIEGLVDDGAVLEHNLGVLDIGLVKEGQGVLHPGLVVPLWEVLVSVGSTRLLAGLGGMHLLGGLVDQVLKLQRLNEVRVPNHAPVGDAHVLVLLHDLVNNALALCQVLRVPVDGCVLLHGDLELAPQLGRRDGALAVPDPVKARDRGLAGVLWQLHRRAVRLHELRRGVCSLPAKDDEVEQGVGAEAVGPVDGRAAGLASGEEPRHDGVALVPDDLRLPVRGDAAHVVVHGREHRGRLLRDVDARKDLGRLGDAGQALSERLGRQVVQVQVDVVLVGAHTTALAHLQGHRAAHDVPGGQVLRRRRVARHEGFTLTVAEDSALPTAALCEKAARRKDAGGVELHELQVLHGQPGARRHGAAVARAGVRGGAGLVGPAEAARGDDRGVRPEAVDGAVLHAEREAAEALAVAAHDEVQGKVLHEEEAVKLQRHAVERVENGVAGTVGRGGAAVRLPALAKLQALAAEGALVDLALGRAGEGEAERLQLQDDLGRQAAHVLDRVLVTEPVRALHRVVGVPAPVVLRHVSECAVDATLGCHRVGPSGEDLGDARRLQAVADKARSRAEAGPAGANDHGVIAVVKDLITADLRGGHAARSCCSCAPRHSTSKRPSEAGEHRAGGGGECEAVGR